MKKNKLKSVIPSWFSLNSYSKLNDLSADALINQLSARKHVLNSLPDTSAGIKHDWITHVINQIQNADILVDGIYELDGSTAAYNIPFGAKYIDYRMSLPKNSLGYLIAPYLDPTNFKGVNSLTLRTIETLHEQSKAEYFYPKEISENMHKKNFKDLRAEDGLDMNILNHRNGLIRLHGLLVSLDLENYRDEQIIENVRESLKIWREKLCIDEPSFKTFVKPKHISKLIEYEVIPYLDLMIYAKRKGISFSHGLLLDTLFLDHETICDELKFRQTFLDFVKKILSTNYRYFQNDDYLS